MENKKEVTQEQFIAFQDLFTSKHPELSRKLEKFNLFNGLISASPTAKMTEEEFDIFTRFTRRWYSDNGFMEEQPDLVYVFTREKTAMAIDTREIENIGRSENGFINVVLKSRENNMITNIVIKEDLEDFKRRVYIF